MLVLTRKLEENVVIDDVITIKVLKVRGGAVRLGIEAPDHVPIRRGELRRLTSQPAVPSAKPATADALAAVHSAGQRAADATLEPQTADTARRSFELTFDLADD